MSALTILVEGKTVTLADPTFTPGAKYNALERAALALILDERDLPFIKLIVKMLAIFGASAAWIFTREQLQWWMVVAHLALVLWFMGPIILMLHNTSHRPLFKAKYRWLRFVIPWGVAPFIGETPETYYSHHIGMHHLENNLANDLSSTMKYQRDRALDFAIYFADFLFLTLFRLIAYFEKKGRGALLRKTLLGEGAWYALAIALYFVNAPAALTVVIGPFLLCRFGMMAGNWAQHAFLDPRDPADPYLNSITCINSLYNRRCFNDGYHIGHHVKSNRHWTDMPRDFMEQIPQYTAKRSVIFEGVDYFVLWFFLMTRNYRAMAKHLVWLGEEKLSEADKIAFLKSRTQRIAIGVPVPAMTR